MQSGRRSNLAVRDCFADPDLSGLGFPEGLPMTSTPALKSWAGKSAGRSLMGRIKSLVQVIQELFNARRQRRRGRITRTLLPVVPVFQTL